MEYLEGETLAQRIAKNFKLQGGLKARHTQCRLKSALHNGAPVLTGIWRRRLKPPNRRMSFHMHRL
jgi:hypothetical protein